MTPNKEIGLISKFVHDLCDTLSKRLQIFKSIHIVFIKIYQDIKLKYTRIIENSKVLVHFQRLFIYLQAKKIYIHPLGNK